MTDNLGLCHHLTSQDSGPENGEERRHPHQLRAQQLHRRRRVVVLAAVAAVVLVAGTAWYGLRELMALRVPDYSGTGQGNVVVRVEQGDTTTAIATRLASVDVVASARAFTRAAETHPRIRSVQPGYYQMRTRMSGAAAVTMLLDPASRVGQLDIRAGTQIDDVRQPDGTLTPGILSLLSRASCVRIDGTRSCVSAEQLREAMRQTPPAELGVPAWAVEPLARVDPGRRLEGLIMPGRYDVRPGSPPVDLLTQVMSTSTARLQGAGMPEIAASTGFAPYQVLIIASIIEKEAIASDFGAVSRVIYNRLAEQMPLQMDSTINYPLDRQHITTTDADRARPGPYNTYLTPGLPASPIGTP
ncbi:MAG: endolytic transglycosylase MltG, partial [Actinomycetota bacterium]|nr:endolytic transglycosylase MltG [Actinomycetota bacterium]